MDSIRTMSKFHSYSLNNTILIALQKPDATYVTGFKTWQNDFERHVKPGEKGIQIFAPSSFTVTKKRAKVDPTTGITMTNPDGSVVMEEYKQTVASFHPITVFDITDILEGNCSKSSRESKTVIVTIYYSN